VTDIVLNLKKVLLICHNRDGVKLMINVNRSGAITAADIQVDHNVEVVNPDQVICTLDREMQFTAELEIKVGRGYCPGDDNKNEDQPIGVIPIDSLFSPVSLVKYSVEATRITTS
jgi:DNA-directed RNA polymerase subunit alpha